MARTRSRNAGIASREAGKPPASRPQPKPKREREKPQPSPAPRRAYTPPPQTPFMRQTARREHARVRAEDKTHRYDTRRPRGGLLGALAGNPLELKGSLGERFTRGGISFALGLPAFAFEAGKASGKDVRNQAILGYKSIREPGKHHGAPPLESVKLLKGMGQATKQTIRHPLRDPFNALLLGSAAYGGAATGFSRAAAFDAARAEGASLRKAATRPGHEGGGLLHTPIPRETTLRSGGKTVKRLEPDQPGLRPLHRRRTKKLQAELDQPPAEPTWREAITGKKGGVPGKAAQVARRKLQLTAEDVFGREWRAMRRIEPTVANAYAAGLARAAKDLTPAEHTAMRIRFIEGPHALKNVDEAVSRHVQTHLGYAEKGINPEINRGIARQAASAAEVLRNPSPRWMKATAQALRLSHRMERELIAQGLLTKESARQSKATLAEVYGRDVTPKADYRGQHQPPGPEDGAPLHKLDDIYPEDVYGPNAAHLYGHSGPHAALDKETVRIVQALRGKPDAKVTIYRGVPANVKEIQPGDWVTPNRGYAAEHIAGEKGWHIISRTVPAREVYTDANSIHEFGWNPPKEAVAGRPPPGSAYFPTGEKFVAPPPRGQPANYAPRPGLTKGPPAVGRYRQGTLKHRTGEAAQHGVVENIPAALTSAYHGHQLAKQALDFHRELWQIGDEVKTHPEQIGVYKTKAPPRELRDEIARAAREGDDDALAQALDRLTQDTIVPGSDRMPAGRKIEGVRWVSRRLVKDIRDTGVTQGRSMKVIRGFNTAVKIPQVYLRPGYAVTNYPQNYVMGAYLHGPRAVAKAMKAARGTRKSLLGDIIEEAMGTSRTESYGIGSRKTKGFVSRSTEKVVEAVTSATDRDFRGAMWLTRARERGYRTQADLIRLATDPKLRDDYIAVTRRARKDAVDFDSITPDERQASEFVYFYPWLSRSTAWAGRTIANRPVRTAVIAEGAKVAHEKEEQRLGPHPSWMQGFIKTRHGLVNPTYASPFGTQAELAMSASDVAKGKKSPFEAVGAPFFQAGGTPVGDPGGARSILGQTGVGGIARRAGFNPAGLFGKPSKTFPDTGIGAAVGPFVAGGFWPRKVDAEAQRKATLMDASGVERVKARHADYAAQYLDILKQAGLAKPSEKKLRAPTQKAIDLRESRFAFRASLNADTLEKKYEADVLWLASQGHGTPEQAQAEIRWARKIPEQRKYLIRQRSQEVLGPIFADLYGDTIHDLRELVRERGYDLPQLR